MPIFNVFFVNRYEIKCEYFRTAKPLQTPTKFKHLISEVMKQSYCKVVPKPPGNKW